MLKIWKRTWTQGPGVDDAGDSRPDSTAGAQLSGTCASPPRMDGTTLVPPENGARDPTADNEGLNQAGLLSNGPPSKRRKLGPGNDSIGQHLPELHEDTVLGDAYLHGSSDREDQLFALAKSENTIASLSSTPAIDRVIFRYLTWAVKIRQSRPAMTKPRVSALIVEDEETQNSYARKLENERGFSSIKYSNYSKETKSTLWAEALLKDVIIVTASALLESFREGHLAVTQFYAFVIPDTQNIKDQDSQALFPLSRIMSEFYRVTEPMSRPKIFAIAKSSLEQDVYDSGLLKLEDLLDGRVFGLTAARRAELMALPEHPSEVILLYNPPSHNSDARLLLNQLFKLDPSGSVFSHHFRASGYALLQVGACASDLVWRRALRGMPDSESGENEPNINVAEQRLKDSIRDTVKNWAFSMPNLDPTSRGFNVTPKFLRLVQVLRSCETYGESFRGIIFVERRAVALAIVDMLRALDDQFGFLRPHAVVGCGSSTMFSRQQEIFRDFTSGTYNLLIATKSIEDLDVPKASLVVRFDLFESHVSYAYTRAHTRGRESHLVYLLERSNDIHRRILTQITQQDSDMLQWTERVGKDPRSSIPPRSLRESNNPYHSDSEDDDDEPDTHIRDPVTNGRIYPQDATTIIYRFASTLVGDSVECKEHGPLFKYDEGVLPNQAPAYKCTVLLPILGTNGVQGPPSNSLAHARRAACFKACQLLFNAGFLDCHLFPQTNLPDSQLNGRLSISPDQHPKDASTVSAGGKPLGIKFYYRAQPEFWKNTSKAKGDIFYPTIVIPLLLSDNAAPYAPMLILTRQPLPTFLSFKLFFVGVPASVRLCRAAPFQISESRLRDLHMYTIRLCRAIGNKPYTCAFEDMLYFWAPLQMDIEQIAARSSDRWRLPMVDDRIPWGLVTQGSETWAVPLKCDTPDEIEEDVHDAVVQDRWVEFTRRYDAIKLRRDLSPLSKPEDSPREENYPNLLEYCKARRKGFEGLKNDHQPLIQVSRCPPFLNRLNPMSRNLTESVKASAKYLIPELCAKFTIPASTFRTAMVLPSVMKRVDEFLIVKQLNAKYFDYGISEVLLHMAISTPSSAIEYDYERLELLGDSFLKYLSSVYVFVTHPTQPEGALHFIRQRIISNKSLFQNSRHVGVPPYILAKPFTVKSWFPPNFTLVPGPEARKETVPPHELNRVEEPDRLEKSLEVTAVDADIASFPSAPQEPTLELEPGEILEEQEQDAVTGSAPNKVTAETDGQGDNAETPKQKKKPKHKRQLDERNRLNMSDKTIADVSEAIIGAAYISGGRETALQAAKALNIPTPNVDRWSDFGRKVLAPHPNYTAKLPSGFIEAVETIIGHKFHRPHLLAQALTHTSFQEHEATSYERLEFLGDAILDFMVIRHIFDRDQQLSPGGLTLLKGAMVSNSTLAAVCVCSGLKEYLLFESYHLAHTIDIYAERLRNKQADEYAAAQKEGRSPGQFWLELEPPKALSDVVESIIGAIYISDNFSPIGAEALFDTLLKPFYDRYITLKTLSHHPTKTLFELFQAQGCQHFLIEKEKTQENATTCHVIVHDIVLASAQDESTSLAARRASHFALDALEGDPEFLTRTCDCRLQPTKKKGMKKEIGSILTGFGEDEQADLLETKEGGSATTGSSYEAVPLSAKDVTSSTEHITEANGTAFPVGTDMDISA